MEIKLVVDGQEIHLNKYVKSIYFEINNGLIKTLRGLNDWTELELQIKK